MQQKQQHNTHTHTHTGPNVYEFIYDCEGRKIIIPNRKPEKEETASQTVRIRNKKVCVAQEMAAGRSNLVLSDDDDDDQPAGIKNN